MGADDEVATVVEGGESSVEVASTARRKGASDVVASTAAEEVSSTGAWVLVGGAGGASWVEVVAREGAAVVVVGSSGAVGVSPGDPKYQSAVKTPVDSGSKKVKSEGERSSCPQEHCFDQSLGISSRPPLN